MKRRRKWLFRSAVAAAFLVVLAAAAVLVPNLLIPASTHDLVFTEAGAPTAPVAIVLGARVYPSGAPSPMLADRLETAVRLYKDGKVRKLLLSGDHGQKAYDEVNPMLHYVRDRGVPDEDVFTDHAGFDTYDSMYRARDVFEVRKAIVVTQEFHLARAVYTARSLGLDAVGVKADIQQYPSESRFVIRDWLARVKAFFQVQVIHPGPKYLGPVIPIDGDGRATRG